MKVLYTTRSRLITSFVGVSLLVGIVSLLIGSRLLYKMVFGEAKTRISLDLNAAREIYVSRVSTIDTALVIAALDERLGAAVASGDTEPILAKLSKVAQEAKLDFAGIVNPRGDTVCRIGPNPVPGRGDQVRNPITDYVLRRNAPVSGTVVLDRRFLQAENPALAEQAQIRLLPTAKAAPRTETEETSGMALAAGVPVYVKGALAGVLYGGTLLNRSNQIVDTVRETVFKDELYKERSVGTATIFLEDLRISTNVLTPEGTRAIGTRVSREVRDKVLIDGEVWTDRAFVVNAWYITAYEPIIDISGDRVGILYVGVLEEKYSSRSREY
jgi:two-component system NtrC family sensor kinase